jgi:organic hydroperoxide reductase OsmC/OhrA
MSAETIHPNLTELSSHSGNGLDAALVARRWPRRPDRGIKSNLDTADSHAVPAATNELFVVPNGRRDGFHATIRGHELELAHPDSGHALAPTPDDLLISSVASDFAWSAQRFLRAQQLPNDVSVSAAWRTHDDPPRLAHLDMTVTVSNSAEAVSETLVAALENSCAARSLNAPLRVRIRVA